MTRTYQIVRAPNGGYNVRVSYELRGQFHSHPVTEVVGPPGYARRVDARRSTMWGARRLARQTARADALRDRAGELVEDLGVRP